MCFGGYEIFSMKNAFHSVGLEPTTSVSLCAAHRAIHLRHGGLGARNKIGCALTDCNLITGLVLLGVLVLVGWLA